jgi:hypothetical protein
MTHSYKEEFIHPNIITPNWLPEEEEYLRILHRRCHRLGLVYKKLHIDYKRTQNKFRLPAILLSSISGVVSFGQTVFPEEAQRWVSISVGGVNIFIAIINTVESYMKIGEMVTKSITSYGVLNKLADDIFCEISIPTKDRETSGIAFLRDCYTRYQQIMDSAPLIEDSNLEVPPFHELKMMGDEIEKKRGFSIFPRKSSRSTHPIPIPQPESPKPSLVKSVFDIWKKRNSQELIQNRTESPSGRVTLEMNEYTAEGLPDASTHNRR